MNKSLKKLIQNDSKIQYFTGEKEIIKQGLTPLLAEKNNSIIIQKANLLEHSKYLNWQKKGKQLIETLNFNSIEFLIFKGFAYTFLIYDESHFRPYSDIDVFIKEKNYDKVEQLLNELGYKKLPSRQGKFISFQNSFYNNQKPTTTIDLHWQINNRIELHKHFEFNRVYRNSIHLKQPNFKTLNQIDAFILACFHYQAHRPEDRKHIWLYDLALLWNKMDDKTQSQCLQASKKKALTHILNAILIQLNNTFKNSINVNLEQLDYSKNSQDYLINRNRKISDIRLRLKNIHGIRNKIKYLSEYIFQKKVYVKERFKVKSNVWIYAYYPRMWIEDLIKLFKS
ncbi:MAG: nucleotidyltransferase family protein [Marinicellaceae bacterium]